MLYGPSLLETMERMYNGNGIFIKSKSHMENSIRAVSYFDKTVSLDQIDERITDNALHVFFLSRLVTSTYYLNINSLHSYCYIIFLTNKNKNLNATMYESTPFLYILKSHYYGTAVPW